MAGPLRTVEVAEPVRSALSLFSGDRLPGGGLSRRWTSAFSGASRRASAFMPIEIGLLTRASAFADARDVFSVGAGRPMAEGLGAD
jgi:hypothetical protein